MPTSAVVQLAPHAAIRDGSAVHKGRLVADETGVACEWTKSTKVSFFKKSTLATRSYFVFWKEVVAYTVGGQEAAGGTGSIMNHTSQSSSTTLTLRTASGISSWPLKCGPASVYQRLGPWLAAVDARAKV